MNLVVISPESNYPRERAVLCDLFAAGLERYHLRKPDWSREELVQWLDDFPTQWRVRVVLHQHHDLIAAFGLGGCHWRDDGTAPFEPPVAGPFTSRSCHDPATLRSTLGHYDAVLFGPVFPSLSKPGYGPRENISLAEVSVLLARRTASERRTRVLAIGGITTETAPRALALGFDGVAALGAIWRAADPSRAFSVLQSSLACHVA
jgi:thiamine-phosphate pyrophosphorylase